MSEHVIEIEKLSRHFGLQTALDEATLKVPRGFVFGVMGENGAGKTTLIKHILGLYKAELGSVRVFGGRSGGRSGGGPGPPGLRVGGP